MDKLTRDEFNTLARTGEVTISSDRNASKIARSLYLEHGITKDIYYEMDEDEGWLKFRIEWD